MKTASNFRLGKTFWGRQWFYTYLLSTLMLFLTSPSLAWFTRGDRGRCGAKSLSIEVSPTETAFSHYCNPAYYPILQEVTLSNYLYFQDMYIGSVFYGRNKLGFEVRYFNFGKFEEIGIASGGEPVYLGTWTPFDLILKAGYSFNGMGIACKFICNQIYYKPEGQGWALAFDMGVKKRIGNIDLTLVGRNIGTKLYYGSGNTEILPVELCQGIRYSLNNIFLLSTEMREPIDNAPYVFLNGELNLFLFCVRLGYNENLQLMDVGCGVRIADITFDYSIQLFHTLGTPHRFSITYSF